ncbi:MAG: T9SS type A sorting domain-containing protein [Crocinitomix sp.]|nr:T9SS type A sorting domain-containing protein [Crocinitomix sp.]
MKNRFLKTLGLGFTLLLGATASAQCLNVNSDFETFTDPIANNNAWINNHLTNWNVSHGTPTPFSSPTTNMWMWSYAGADSIRGEGLYTDFNFVSGNTYEVCYDLWRDGTSNDTSEFHVEIVNGLVPSPGTWASIPTPPSSQALTTQPWVNTGVWVTITETFTAGANYSQLWLYPRLDGLPNWQAACRIDNVCIKDVVTDPCDFEPNFTVTYDDECNVHFAHTTAVPSGLTILDISWDFGDGTTGNGMSIDHFYTSGGLYQVCMTVWMINAAGECCKKTICQWIDGPHCDPCDWLSKAGIVVTGSNPYDFTISGLPAGLFSQLGFHWDFGDGTTGTGYPISHSYATTGSKKVCVTIYYYNPETQECCNITVCYDLIVRTIVKGRGQHGSTLEEGVNYEKGNFNKLVENFNKIILAPNPSNGSFEIRLKDGSSIETVHVYDQAGKLVHSTDNGSAVNLLQMDLKQLEKGMYFITVNQDNALTRTVEKVIIE